MAQSNLYKHTNAVEYLSDFPGARRETDTLVAVIDGGEVDIVSDPRRMLGEVSIADDQIDVSHVTIGEVDDVVTVQQQDDLVVESLPEPLDVSGENVPVYLTETADVQGEVDVEDRENRVLGVVSLDEVVEVDPLDNDHSTEKDAVLDANASLTISTAAQGAERIVADVHSTGSYTVELELKDADGVTIRTKTVASAVAGGSWTEVDQRVSSPHVDVVVTDESGAEQSVDATVNMT